MKLWKLHPKAQVACEEWRDRPIWEELLVTADTEEQARSHVASWESVKTRIDRDESAFRDRSLYDAVEAGPTHSKKPGVIGVSRPLTSSGLDAWAKILGRPSVGQ